MVATNPATIPTILLLLVSLSVIPNGTVRTHPEMAPEKSSFAPASTSPYVTTFQISRNFSDFTPFVISPATQRSAWVLMIQTRNGKPPLAQIINFTIGPEGYNWTYALSQPLVNIPSDIVYNQTSQGTRVWLLENDSLAYYEPVSRQLMIAQAFRNDSPQYMSLDKQGDVWLTLLTSNRVAEFYPENDTTRFYSAPTSNAGLQGIAVAPDGSIWFAETIAKKLGHLVPCNSPPCNISDYSPPLTIPVSFPIQIAVDHTGTVWFTDHGSNQFGSYTPSTNQWNTLPIGYCSESYNPECAIGLPNAISVDSDGLVWFSEHFAGRIAKYDQKTGLLTEYVVPATATPYTWWMQPGPGNRVWFTAFGLGKIGYVNSTIPVPFSLSTTNILRIPRGSSENIQTSIENPNTTVSVNLSITSYDAPYGGPSLLYGSTVDPEIGPSRNSTVVFTIFASWDLSLGERNMAITEYDGNVNVNAYVRVDVVETLAYFAAPIAASSIGVGAVILFWLEFGKKRNTRKQREDDSGTIPVQSQ